MNSPVDTVNAADPGDAMQRNLRYQHGYGIILLLGVATGKLDYKAIWCEQREDLLGEVSETLFDAYQVKTQKPERGYWETLDEGFSHSIQRFCDHEALYPSSFRAFAFVSNTECLDSIAEKKEKRSPVRLLASISTSATIDDLAPEPRTGLTELAKAIERPETILFSVLKKTKFVVGPSRDAFLAELAINHLPQFKELEDLTADRLQQVASDLIGVIAEASALASKDPSRHYMHLATMDTKDPQLAAKRIDVATFTLKCRELRVPLFKYLKDLTCQPLQVDTKTMDRFQRKLDAGGLADFAGNLHSQALSAHAVLLETATRHDGNDLVVQVEHVVQNECAEAELRAKQKGSPYGSMMLVDVQDRLKKVASERPQIAGKVAYETLMGMAGLLTEECTVWWSERFDLEKI